MAEQEFSTVFLPQNIDFLPTHSFIEIKLTKRKKKTVGYLK